MVTFQTDTRDVFVNDLTNGIYVAMQNASFDLHPGQIIEFTGKSSPGNYAPSVDAQRVTVLGERPLPPARHVPFDKLISAQEDCQCVEVEGVVHWVSQEASNRYNLDLETDGNRLRVYLLDSQPGNPERLVDATVRMRAVRGDIFNDRRQLLAPLLFTYASDIQIEEPAPRHPYDVPIRPFSALLQYDPALRYGHRIKARGVVTHQVPGTSVFIESENHGLLLQTLETNALKTGDIIEALGFETVGKYAPYLEDVVYRCVGKGPTPQPSRISVAEALTGRYNADLVSLEGQLVGIIRQGKEEVLIMKSGGALFNAQLFATGGALSDISASEGSRLEVTGICLVERVTETRSTVTPESFRILLRSISDVVVMEKPPWLTAQRAEWVVPLLILFSLTAMAAVIVRSRLKMRLHNQERAAAEGRLLAIMSERSRMAREIHDTLAQGYTAISAQLEILKDKVSGSPTAMKHLELARSFVRANLAEARRSIWELRSQVLTEHDLGTALATIGDQLVAGATTRIDFSTEGVRRDLPASIENNLLRIGQEAITNAVKHAQCSRIIIRLTYEPQTVRLTVRDDGCGFDTSKKVVSKNSGFGLVGMRERAEELGCKFSVESAPDLGTSIMIEVPA